VYYQLSTDVYSSGVLSDSRKRSWDLKESDERSEKESMNRNAIERLGREEDLICFSLFDIKDRRRTVV
jgi:hypothetical protein